MKNYIEVVLFSLYALFHFSCTKKELIEEKETAISFYFNGDIGVKAITLQAGKNDYYLYTSYNKGLNDVYSFSGNFSQSNCNTCTNTLKVSFTDYKSSLNASTEIDSTLYKGMYNYATPSGKASRFLVNFTQNTLGTPNSFLWDFGDGTTSNLMNPSHVYVRPGSYNVCLTVSFQGGCESSICNTLVLGGTNNPCEANFNVSAPTGNSLSFLASPTGTAPFTYNWDFGDGNTSNNQSITHVYLNSGTYTVSLKVTDANGNEGIKRLNVRTQGTNTCITKYFFNKSDISNPENLGNVEIEWTNDAGVTYSSKNDNQHTSSYFEVKEVSEGNTNENNQLTKKLKIQCNAWLYNANDSVEIKTSDATIGVAYLK